MHEKNVNCAYIIKPRQPNIAYNELEQIYNNISDARLLYDRLSKTGVYSFAEVFFVLIFKFVEIGQNLFPNPSQKTNGT